MIVPLSKCTAARAHILCCTRARFRSTPRVLPRQNPYTSTVFPSPQATDVEPTSYKHTKAATRTLARRSYSGAIQSICILCR